MVFFSKAELTEWHRHHDSLALRLETAAETHEQKQRTDDVQTSSVLNPRKPTKSKILPGAVVRANRRIIKYEYLEREKEIDHQAIQGKRSSAIMADTVDRMMEDIMYTSPGSPESMRTVSKLTPDRRKAVSFTANGIFSASSSPPQPSAPDDDKDEKKTFRKQSRTISGAMINSLSGRESYLAPRRTLTAKDIAKSKLRKKAVTTTLKQTKENKAIETVLNDLRSAPELVEELLQGIEKAKLKKKEKAFGEREFDAVMVNVERVKCNYYCKDVDKIKKMEKHMDVELRREIFLEKQRIIEEENSRKVREWLNHIKMEDKKTQQLIKKKQKKSREEEMRGRAQQLSDKQARVKFLLKIVVLAAKMRGWELRATTGEGSLQAKKRILDSARKIQRLYRARKNIKMGQRFREAVVNLRKFVCRFIDAWRARRLRGAANIIVHFLLNANDAPIKWIMHSFVLRVQQCQRIWRGFILCTKARIHLLKLLWQRCEDINFKAKRKELIEDANRRKAIEVELHSHRFMLVDEKKAAKFGHRTVDDKTIQVYEGNEVNKKLASHKGGGDHMLIMDRMKLAGGGGNVMKTIEVGLRSAIKKAKLRKASEEVKNEFLAEFLFNKRREYRAKLASFAERKRKRELASVRDMTANDAKQLLETGKPPRQLLANVAIAAGIGVGREYMFEFGFEADDAYKMLQSIDIENEMCVLVEKGVAESEARTWKRRHGLDKSGKRRVNSLYVVEDDATNVDNAKEASMTRLAMTKKSRDRMADMKRTQEELHRDFVISSDPIYSELEVENEEADYIENKLEHEDRVAAKKLLHSEEVMEKVHKQDIIHDAQDRLVDMTGGKFHPRKYHVPSPEHKHGHHHHHKHNHSPKHSPKHKHRKASLVGLIAIETFNSSVTTRVAQEESDAVKAEKDIISSKLSPFQKKVIQRRKSSLLVPEASSRRRSLFGKFSKHNLSRKSGEGDNKGGYGGGGDDDSDSSTSNSSWSSSSSGYSSDERNDNVSNLKEQPKIVGIGGYQERASTHRRRSSVLISDLVVSKLMRTAQTTADAAMNN